WRGRGHSASAHAVLQARAGSFHRRDGGSGCRRGQPSPVHGRPRGRTGSRGWRCSPMRSFGQSLVFVWLTLSLAVAAVLLPGVANADQSPAPAPSLLKLSMMPRPPLKGIDVTGQYLLTATLTTQDGKPINNVTVSFYEQAQLFGTREALLGTAITDSTGSAS